MAISIVRSMHRYYSLTIGGRIKSKAKITALIRRIQRTNCLFGTKVLLLERIADLLIQRMELIIFQYYKLKKYFLLNQEIFEILLVRIECYNTRIMHGVNVRARNSVPKKKRLDYYQQLEKAQHKVYEREKRMVCWVNNQGNQCRRIIQPNRCFCHHSFLLHNNQSKQNFVKCLAPGCKCKSYQYVPYYDIKCMCRHSYKNHNSQTKKCEMCRQCLGFLTNWSCKCGMKFQLHRIQVKKRERKGQASIDREKIMTISIRGRSEGIKTISNKSHLHNKENFEYENHFEEVKNEYFDQRNYQISKFDKEIDGLNRDELEKDKIRKKHIQRINKKFGDISFEKSVQKMMMSQMKMQPCEARQVSALELIIKPHNYTPVRIDKYLSLLRKKTKENI